MPPILTLDIFSMSRIDISTTTLADQGHGLDFHEAQITPNDTALVLVYRLYEEENLLSGVVQEINVTSGEAIFTWDSRDHIDPEECYAGRTDAAWDYIVSLYPFAPSS